MDRYEEQQKRWDLRFGVVAAAYINCKLKEGAEPIKPGYFFGYESEEEDYEMTPAETVAHIKALTTPKKTKIKPQRIQR